MQNIINGRNYAIDFKYVEWNLEYLITYMSMQALLDIQISAATHKLDMDLPN